MDEIKEAFRNVKKDFDFLYGEIFNLKKEVLLIQHNFSEIEESLVSLNKKIDSLLEKEVKTQREPFSSNTLSVSTDYSIFKVQKAQNLGISTGNEGVQTDRQTDRQTDKFFEKKEKIQKKTNENSFEELSGLLDSLDNLKKEVRLKFKRLTDQELTIFSTIYQMEEEKGFSDYKSLSQRLSLTESSIRDYVRRLILKGIPIEKKKINNKEIKLFVSESLKKIASLNTILRLIEL